MNFRHPTTNDSPALVNLLRQLGYNLDAKQMADRIQAYSKNDHEILIAEENNLIVGLIAYLCYEQFVAPFKCCRVDALIIHEDYRGRGVGKQLVAFAEKFAAQHNANLIELITAEHRKITGTHKFYESLGYKDHDEVGYTYFLKELSNGQEF